MMYGILNLLLVVNGIFNGTISRTAIVSISPRAFGDGGKQDHNFFLTSELLVIGLSTNS